MTMNRIHKIVFTMACLLTATGAWAYTIRLNTPSNGTMSSDVTNANHGETVTLTVNPTGDYYLSELYYEKVVTDIGTAESPSRRSPSFSEKEPPSFSEKEQIPIKTTNQSNRNNHYGGTYEISMPPYDIEVTAIFSPCTPITGATLHWDSSSSSTSITYDGSEHTANVYLGSSDLELNANYTIDTNKLTNVGGITPTITGVGTYCGTINDQTISITQRPLTITAQPQTITYGSSIQTGISYVNVSGLVTNDALTSITLTPSTSQVTTTGTITPSGATTTKGISNYAVTYNTGALTINPKDLSAMVTVTLNEEYHNYDGSQHQPIFNNESTGTSIVNYGNTRLVEGSDFTCSYTTTPGIYTNGTDYIKPDIYTITVTFKGNYTGSKTVEYQIRKEITLNSSNDYRWRTFYEQTYNMGKDDNYFLAYTIRDVTTNAVVLDGPTVIKAGVPMVLYRTSVTDSGIYPPLIKTTDSNLTGTIWTNAYSQYKCKVDDNGVPIAWDLSANDNIMILVDDKFVRSKSGTLAAGKCYLDVSSSSPSPAPSLVLEATPTGIEEIEMRDTRTDNQFYDLSGRKISHPTKGLYIVNGKKIIIK